jgi:Raf kinase inhibitor-like YbhB/YbcL family protein
MPTITQKECLSIKSAAFVNKGFIPPRYSYKGANINPELNIKNLPEDTRTLALIMEDLDAPGKPFVHWIMWNIPPMLKIEENSFPGIQGRNDKNENKYDGPDPGKDLHRYRFLVYALNKEWSLPDNADKEMLLSEMKGNIVALGGLEGFYETPEKREQ